MEKDTMTSLLMLHNLLWNVNGVCTEVLFHWKRPLNKSCDSGVQIMNGMEVSKAVNILIKFQKILTNVLAKHVSFECIRFADISFQCCDRKSRAACAQSFTPWQQATIEIMLAISLTIACSRYTYDGVILHAHPARGESHIQRNTTGEVATPTFFVCQTWVTR